MMNISFLGTGILGYPMAEKLLERGHQLFIYNRTIKKAERLKAAGAKVYARPKDAIKPGEVIILVLSDAQAVESVLFDEERLLKGKTVIQMGTIASTQSRYFQKRVEHLGGQYFECPVLGSRREVAGTRLILLVGASREQFSEYQDLLKCFGPKPYFAGEVGQAAALKLALNQLIAAHAVCFSLSLGLVKSKGIDVDLFMSVLKDSSLYAPMYAKKLSNWLNSDYTNPNFPLKHLIKDVDLILAEVNEAKLNTKVLASIRELLKQSEKEGLAALDYSAVYETINKK